MKKKDNGEFLLNFYPADDKLVVRQQEAQEVTEGGLYIPDTAKDKPMEGIVLAADKNLQWKVGDLVLFGKYDGVEVSIDGDLFLLLDNEDILGKRL